MTDTPAQGIRARNRAALEEEILAVATRHLARSGAAALSLRAVARDLGLAPSALYRYVASRDDLLTLLIVRAYNELGDAVDAALAAVDDGVDTPAATAARAEARFRAITSALWQWARAHPHQYALIYGSPVPEYHAPAERTTPAGTRVQAHLLTVLRDLARSDAGAQTDEAGPAATAAVATRALASLLDDPLVRSAGLPPTLLLRGLGAWNLVLGTVGCILFEQLGPDVPDDPDAYVTATTDLALELVRAPR